MGYLVVIAIVATVATIVCWVAVGLSKGGVEARGRQTRRTNAEIISPLFQGRFGDFYLALDVPLERDQQVSKEDATKCGRHIMNYLAHNPEEAALFTRGLSRWNIKGSNALCDPVTAASSEVIYDAKAEVHATSYRAIESLIKQNNLACFKTVDRIGLMTCLTEIGRKDLTGPLAGQLGQL